MASNSEKERQLYDVLSTSDDDDEVEPKDEQMKMLSKAGTSALALAVRSQGYEDLSTSDDDDESEPINKRIKLSNPKAGTSASAIRKKNVRPPEYITELKALTVAQLVDVIATVIEKHPEIKNDFIQHTPTPDLQPFEKKLEQLTKNISKAFPYTRYGSDRDAFCFRRVKVHLSAFQKECFEQCKSLIDSHQWKSSIDYIIMAWKFCDELPDWDNEKNNKLKENCFKRLTSNLCNSLKKGKFQRQELQKCIERFKKLDGMEDSIKLAETLLNKVK